MRYNENSLCFMSGKPPRERVFKRETCNKGNLHSTVTLLGFQNHVLTSPVLSDPRPGSFFAWRAELIPLLGEDHHDGDGLPDTLEDLQLPQPETSLNPGPGYPLHQAASFTPP